MLYDRFRAGDPDEAERLSLLAAAYDPITLSRLDRLGLPPGSCCIDVGAGLGTVAQHLAAGLGPTGTVVATDLVDYADPRDPVHLTRKFHDLTDTDLPGGPYDLVFARALLHFLPRADHLLRRLERALRPGGVVAVETFDFGAAARLGDPAGRAWQMMLDSGTRVGIRLDWWAGLTRSLAEHGLGHVLAESTTVHGPPGSAVREYWARSLLVAVPFIATSPEEREVVRSGAEHIRSHPDVVRLPSLSAVYGRRL